jgi:hypothetical protein
MLLDNKMGFGHQANDTTDTPIMESANQGMVFVMVIKAFGRSRIRSL